MTVAFQLGALIAILLGGLVSTIDWDRRCTRISSVTGSLKYTSRETQDVVMSMVIDTNIGLAETLCFHLDFNDSLPGNKSKIVYTLSLKEVKQKHQVLNSYQAAIPEPRLGNCFCDCPCFANNKAYEKDYCHGGFQRPQPCVNIYKDTETGKGCPRIQLDLCLYKHSSATCSFYVERGDTPLYDVIEIGTSNTWLLFELASFREDSGDRAGKTKIIEYNLQDARAIQLEKQTMSTLSVEGPGIPSTVPAGWYFKPETTSDLFTGIEINGMNSYSLDKFGWFRWKDGATIFPSKLKEEVKKRFSYTITRCGGGRIELYWDFSGRYTMVEFKDATMSLVTDQYRSTLQSVKADSRVVSASLRTSPRYSAVLEFEEKAEVVFYFDKSHLVDFSVVLQTDRHSNKFLNFSLTAVAGALIGTLTERHATSSTYSFTLYVGATRPRQHTASVQLPPAVTCNKTLKYTVCLQTPRGKASLCRQPSIKCDQLRAFEVPKHDIVKEVRGEPLGQQGGFWDDVRKFLEHINPVKWITALSESLSDAFAWGGVIINIVLFVTVVAIVVNRRRCCRCCLGKVRRRERGNSANRANVNFVMEPLYEAKRLATQHR